MINKKEIFQFLTLTIRSEKVLLAISGGADSILLLHMIHQWTLTSKLNTKIAVCHVDHNIRYQSSQDSVFVRKICSNMNIPIFVKTIEWKESPPTSNIQSRCRTKRYKILEGMCNTKNIKYLLTGHHRDDNIETFLLNLERGSGIDGLSSIARCKKISKDLTILRPLLNIGKEDIYSYLKAHNFDWIEDPSNTNTKYKRNFLRKIIDTESLTLKNRILNTISHIQNSMYTVYHYAYIEMQKIITVNHGFITIEISSFVKLPQEIQSRILMWCIQVIGGKPYKPKYTTLQRILSSEKISLTISSCYVKKTKKELKILKEYQHITDVIEILPNGTILWDKRFTITNNSTTTLSVTRNSVEYINSEHKTLYTENVLLTMPIAIIEQKTILLINHLSGIRITFNFYSLLHNIHPWFMENIEHPN
ncbi:MAG: tRNA(Ile)-lysidine synthetase [Candidatus Xenolissoclinum pacificiensis L6]|uniref:tRNA(Ile)-lysidine synthase n=1 Tax=Candidatus Xenolissoclinum pacificiensis L6 TaxID=1401685 RepID=W2UZV2_9RICK|nr:MAG: tRNA(Ile)-lysidine synthetase [Candidatus Xenolissoclinum pacificiensis L6]